MLTRRGLLKASLPIIAAPAIIRVASLMRIKPQDDLWTVEPRIYVDVARFLLMAYSDASSWVLN